MRYKQLNTYLKNNYIMGMDRYPQDLLGVIKLLNNHIIESGNNRSFRNISRKEQTRVAFTQTQEKEAKDNKKTNIKGESHCFHCGKQYH